jgi:hypothetical protein
LAIRLSARADTRWDCHAGETSDVSRPSQRILRQMRGCAGLFGIARQPDRHGKEIAGKPNF